uniref:Uncharacterized protein n=1 Tax=Leersia perrieri TaxID=77586 RepID=A0A0D9WFF0_9ORYZ
MFHQPCIVAWLRSGVTIPPLRCPLCHAPISTTSSLSTSNNMRSFTPPTFCPIEYDIESQLPAPPGEEVAEAVGGSRGWLRSSIDRLSDSWRACSGSHAAAAVVGLSSRRTTGSWSPGSSGRHHFGAESCGVQAVQVQLPVLPPADADEEEVAAEADAGGYSHGWFRSSLATLSGSWAVFPGSRSAAVELPVSSRHTTGGSLNSNGGMGSWSTSWDPEAAVAEPREKPSVFDYARCLAIYGPAIS